MTNEISASKVHRFVATAFKPDFPMHRMPDAWSSTYIPTDSKDTKAKRSVDGGTIYAFNYGVLVFVDVNPAERVAEIDELARALSLDLSEQVTTEGFIVEEAPHEKPRAEFKRLILDYLTPERMAVIALILSQSAAMEYYEGVVAQTKTKVLDLISILQEKGVVPLSPRRLNRFIGAATAMNNEVVGILHVLDKPDIIWEDATMDRLYDDLRAVFDLNDRFQALHFKLQLIRESLLLLLETKRDSRLYGADLMIIFLIVIEVLFSIFQRFHLFGW